MPYIRKVERMDYDPYIQDLVDTLHKNEWRRGDMNYIFSCILTEYWHRFIGYSAIDEIAGVCINVKDEFMRIYGNPYEEKKRAENGPLRRFISRPQDVD